MGFFYIDESIHEKHGFIIASIVYSKIDLNPYVSDALASLGFDPINDEFKSSMSMKEDINARNLRNAISEIFEKYCKFGLVVLPANERDKIANYSMGCLLKIIKKNKLKTSENNPHQVYFDQGIKPAKNIGKFKNFLTLNYNQDSKYTRGIQISDYASHACAMLLLSRMGIITKKIYLGESWGILPNTELPLAYEIFSKIRRSFFVHTEDIVTDNNLRCSGLHISQKCNEAVKQYALDTFSKIWYGCMH